MNRVAIVSDSNSGITQAQAKELGVTILPMPFFAGDKTYYEDIDLNQEQFYQLLTDKIDISTSMPLVGNVTDTWDRLLEEYDEIVHIPMSSGLSGSCETAIMLSQDYDGKVQVVNNQRISVTQRQSVLDAMNLAKQGKSAAEIKEILERDKFESSIYIMVDTLYYLKKGGRITPAAAALGTLLKFSFCYGSCFSLPSRLLILHNVYASQSCMNAILYNISFCILCGKAHVPCPEILIRKICYKKSTVY